VARRLEAYARRVGAQNVMAGTDCGFATWAGNPWVAPLGRVGKFESMAEGARLATDRLSRERLAAI